MADENENPADGLLADAEAMSNVVSMGKDAPVLATSPADGRNLDMIMDIPLKVTVELGRTKMAVSELLNLGQGSVIELSKLAGEPMEVLVNDKLVARGEAVVVNEKFGIRLTDIISKSDRIESLK
jgi:flagellar motor switch protein FliN/FliY